MLCHFEFDTDTKVVKGGLTVPLLVLAQWDFSITKGR